MMNNNKYTYNFLYSIVEEVMEDLDLEADKFTIDENVKKAINDDDLQSEIYSSVLELVKEVHNLD